MKWTAAFLIPFLASSAALTWRLNRDVPTTSSNVSVSAPLEKKLASIPDNYASKEQIREYLNDLHQRTKRLIANGLLTYDQLRSMKKIVNDQNPNRPFPILTDVYKENAHKYLELEETTKGRMIPLFTAAHFHTENGHRQKRFENGAWISADSRKGAVATGQVVPKSGGLHAAVKNYEFNRGNTFNDPYGLLVKAWFKKKMDPQMRKIPMSVQAASYRGHEISKNIMIREIKKILTNNASDNLDIGTSLLTFEDKIAREYCVKYGVPYSPAISHEMYNTGIEAVREKMELHGEKYFLHLLREPQMHIVSMALIAERMLRERSDPISYLSTAK